MGTPYTYIHAATTTWQPTDLIVEIGSDRGGGSTQYFATLARTVEVDFYTVDFHPDVYGHVKDLPGVHAVRSRGEDWLAHDFPQGKHVKVAYLDNFDWWWKTLITEEQHRAFGRDRYEPFGLRLGNEHSQRSHLEQARLIHRHSTLGTVVLFDDTWLMVDGRFNGKGGTAVPYLLREGYRVLNDLVPSEELHGGYVLLQR